MEPRDGEATTVLFVDVEGEAPSSAGSLISQHERIFKRRAVVAREYGIPAVVGTKIATRRIQDGMLITVDGTQGVVRIED